MHSRTLQNNDDVNVPDFGFGLLRVCEKLLLIVDLFFAKIRGIEKRERTKMLLSLLVFKYDFAL